MIAEEDEAGEDDEGFADEEDDTALKVVADEADDGAEEDAPATAIARADTGSDTWQAAFERVEEAWLAGRTIGDPARGTQFPQ